jgi:predicted nucleic acid-binding protein
VTEERGDGPTIVDASVAVAWCISTEAAAATDRMLISVARTGMLGPAIWWIEVANSLIMAVRRGRLGPCDWSRLEGMLSRFKTQSELVEPARVVEDVSQISQKFGLTAYDASYLELALRSEAQLATLDKRLIEAAQRAGVPLFNL